MSIFSTSEGIILCPRSMTKNAPTLQFHQFYCYYNSKFRILLHSLYLLTFYNYLFLSEIAFFFAYKTIAKDLSLSDSISFMILY